MFPKMMILAAAAIGIPLAVVGSGQPRAETLPRHHSAAWQTAQNNNFPNTINGRPLEDAPVSGLREGRVAPVDRAGQEESASQASGPVGSTPFSGAPQSERATASPQLRSEPDATNSNVTPRLTK